MKKTQLLSLTLAVFLLLSTFTPFSFARTSTGGTLYTDITSAGIVLALNDAEETPGRGDVRTGKRINARLVLSGQFLNRSERVSQLDIVIKSDSMNLKKPETNSEPGENVYVTYAEGAQELTISIYNLPHNEGFSWMIPFYAEFPNGTTPDGETGVVYVDRIVCDSAEYAPPEPSLNNGAYTGSSKWNFVTAGYDYFSTASAIAKIDWNYVTGNSSKETVRTIPASQKQDADYLIPDSGVNGKSFGFVLKTQEGRPYNDAYGRMNATEARPAAIVTIPQDSRGKISFDDKDADDVFAFDVNDRPTAIRRMDADTYFMYWEDAGIAEHKIYIKKIHVKDGGSFSGATITMTPVTYIPNFDLNGDGNTDAGDSVGYATAVDQQNHPIKTDAAKNLTIHKTAPVDDSAKHENDDKIEVKKSLQSWYYDLSSDSLGDGAFGDKLPYRRFITNDPLFKSPNRQVQHGNRIWFDLRFKNNTDRDVLSEVVLRETAEAGNTNVGKTTSFDRSRMFLRGFDPGRYDSIGKTNFSVKVYINDETSAKASYDFLNKGSNPAAGNKGDWSDLYAKMNLSGNDSISKIEFIYTDVPRDLAFINPPRVLFQAAENAHLYAGNGGSAQFANCVFMDVKPFDGASGDDVKHAKSLENVEYKNSGIRTVTSKEALSAKKDGVDTLKNNTILAGSVINYAINISNTTGSLEENAGWVLIKDLLDGNVFDTASLSNAKLKVQTSAGNEDPLRPKGVAAPSAPGLKAAYEYSVTPSPFDASAMTAHEKMKNGVENGESGFYLWLRGNFLPSDKIVLTFDIKLKDLLPKSTSSVNNTFKYMLVHRDFDPDNGDDAPGGSGIGGTKGPGEWSENHPKQLTVRTPNVYADIKSSVKPGRIDVAGTPAREGSTDYYLYPYKHPGQAIEYRIEASLPGSELSGNSPVIVDQLPPGFTLDKNALNLKVANSSAWSEGTHYSKQIIEPKGKDPAFLIVKAINGNTLQPGEKLVITFDAKAPTQIRFHKDSKHTKDYYRNFVFFDPNGGAYDNSTSAADAQTAGMMKKAANSVSNYPLYRDSAPHSVVTGNITGIDASTTLAHKDNRRYLYATADTTFTKPMPDLTLTKTAYTDKDRDGKYDTPAGTNNRLFANETVYYKSEFINNADSNDAVGFQSVVDYLPPGQEYVSGSVRITVNGTDIAPAPALVQSQNGDPRRLEFRSASIVTLAAGMKAEISYFAKVSKEADVVRDLIPAKHKNQIAVYPSGRFFSSASPVTGYQGGDKIWGLQAPNASDPHSLVKAATDVYYDVDRIHPHIQKDAMSISNPDTVLSTGISPGFDKDTNISWRIKIANSAGVAGHSDDMSDYTIYDELPFGVSMTPKQIDAFNDKYGKQGFKLEYNDAAGTVKITGGPVLKPGDETELTYQTLVPFGAAIAGAISNRAYLVPNASQYFEAGDTKILGKYSGVFIANSEKNPVPEGKPRAVVCADTVSFTTDIAAHASKFVTTASGATVAGGEEPLPVKRGEDVTYTYKLENGMGAGSRNPRAAAIQSKSFERFTVIDTLPRENDRYAWLNIGGRGSDWGPVLPDDPKFTLYIQTPKETQEPVPANAYRIYFSDTVTKAVDMGAGGTINDWAENQDDPRWTLVKDVSDTGLKSNWRALLPGSGKPITAFKVVVDRKLSHGEIFQMTWSMHVPESIEKAPMDKTAYNNAAFAAWVRYEGLGEKDLRFVAESGKVGVRVEGGSGSLNVTKRLTNPGEFEERAFNFTLFKEGEERSAVYLSPGAEGGCSYAEVGTPGSSPTFGIDVPSGESSAHVTIDNLPEGHYMIEEVGAYYYDYQTSIAYDGPAIDGNKDDNGLLTDAYVNPYEAAGATVINIAARPYSLIAEKHLVNRAYASHENFEFKLEVKNAAGAWDKEPVRLAPTASEGVYRYDKDGGLNKFTVKMPAASTAHTAIGQAVIENLPVGAYRVVELTTGYKESYAYYAYDKTNKDAVPIKSDNENAGLYVNADYDVHYTVKIINTADKRPGGGGDKPKPPENKPGEKKPEDKKPEDKKPEDKKPPEDGDKTRPEIPSNTKPGGKDQASPPRPTLPGNSLTPAGDGAYIEIGEDGTPLGEWRWDEPTEQWIFDEYPPLANLPQTGFRGEFEERGRAVRPFICPVALLLLIGAAMLLVRARRKNSRDAQK